MGFKIGDTVKAKPNAPYSHTAGNATLRVVAVGLDTIKVLVVRTRTDRKSYCVDGEKYVVLQKYFINLKRNMVNK